MYKVGITGGIGAGKSLICNIFQSIGIPVYDADARAKQLIFENAELKRMIIDLLGPESYLPNGEYNRAWVGTKVFNDQQKLQALNHLVHPAVHKDAADWFEAKSTPYALYEAALIIEGNTQDIFDALICVTAPKELRIERVMKRNGISREAVESRIANQSTENEKRKHCHFEVINDEQHFLIPQVYRINKILIERATNSDT